MIFNILLVILSIFSFYSVFILKKKRDKVVYSLLSKHKKKTVAFPSGDYHTGFSTDYKQKFYFFLNKVSIIVYGNEDVKKNITINLMLIIFAAVIVKSKINVHLYIILPAMVIPFIAVNLFLFSSKKQMFLLNDLIMTVTVFNNVISSGRAINDAFKACSEVEHVSILKYEYQMMTPLINRGYDIDSCIKAIYMLERYPYPEYAFFFSTLSLNIKRGGPLTEPISKIRKTLDDKMLIDKEVSRLTAEARTSMKILIALPFFFVGIMYATQKESFDWLFHSAMGNIIFLSCSLVICCGLAFNYRLISKATRI